MAGIEKELMFKEIKSCLEGNDIFIACFSKVSVENLNKLRSAIRKNAARGIVAKHSIAKRVFKDLGLENAAASFSDTMFLVAAPEEPQKVSKELVDFTKDKETFSIQGVVIDGTFQPEEYVAALAELPSREQLLASVVGGIKAPVTNFVFVLNSLLRSFVVVLNEVGKKKNES